MHIQTVSLEDFRSFLQSLVDRPRSERKLGITSIRCNPCTSFWREEHVQLTILLKLVNWLHRFTLDSSPSHKTRSDITVVDDCKELDTILGILSPLSIDSFSSSQDIYTIVSYTHRFVSKFFTSGWESLSDGHFIHTHSLSSVDREAEMTHGSRKRKRQVSNVSFMEEDPSPCERPFNKITIESLFPSTHAPLLHKLLQLVIESLTLLRECINSKRSPLHEYQTRVESTLDAPWNENNLLHSITTCFADTPIHHYYHLATVLCRVAIPQCPSLLLYLAQQQGTFVASSHFVRGCIDAFRAAKKINDKSIFSSDIQNVAKDSIQSIANVSPHERIQIVSILRENRIMPDIFLSLVIQEGNDMTLFHILLSEMLKSTCASKSRRNEESYPPFINYIPDDESWIQNDLRMNKNITDSILGRLTNHLLSLTARPRHKISWGEASLSLNTLTLFIITADVRLEMSDILIANTMNSLVEMIPLYSRNRFDDIGDLLLDDTVPLSSTADNFLKISLCTCIILSMAYLSSRTTDSLSFSSCQQLFKRILMQMQSVSKRATIFARNVLNMLTGEQDQEFQYLIRNILSHPNIPWNAEMFRIFCAWSRLLLHPHGETEDPKTSDMSKGRLYDSVECTLAQSILHDPQQCQDIIYGRHVLSSCRISDILAPISGVPLICPLQIEKQEKALRLNFPCPDMDYSESNGYHSQYLLQVLYCLLFLERQPLSPFTIDPRNISLGNVLFLASESSRSLVHSETDMSVLLFPLIAKHCPDIAAGWKASQHSFLRTKEAVHGMHIVSATVESSILTSLSGHLIYDENLFFLSRAFCPSSDMDTKVVKTLLESIENKRLFVSYKSLIEDPLQIFKIRLASWQCAGLRNVLVSILQRLFLTNTALSMRRCPSADEVTELLLARDVIAVKCFITVLSHLKKHGYTAPGVSSGPDGSYFTFFTDQDVLYNFVRCLVAQRRGLFTYIGQDSNRTADEIAALVPECILDFVILSTQFARSDLRIADKLSLCEMCMRIVTLFSPKDAVDVLIRAVLGFMACLTFHTERSILHYNTTLRILSSIESLPATTVGVVDIKNEARCVLGKIQGKSQVEASCGSGPKRNVMNL